MNKMTVVDDILKHTDEEVIEYLSNLLSEVNRGYHNTAPADMASLVRYAGDIEMAFLVLRALKRRNDGRKAENNL